MKSSASVAPVLMRLRLYIGEIFVRDVVLGIQCNVVLHVARVTTVRIGAIRWSFWGSVGCFVSVA